MRAIPTLAVLSAMYLVSMMFALGLELPREPEESKEQKRAKRWRLVRGLVVSLIVFPAVGFAIVRGLRVSGDIAIALLLLSAAPGGRFAPHLVKLAGGDVPLAVELTLFLAKITAFTAAPTARWLLGVGRLDVRELPLIAQLLFLQIVPLYAGKWFRQNRRARADRLLKPARSIAALACLAVFGTVLLREDRGLAEILRDRAWLAVAAVGVAWALLGWLLAGGRARRTMSISAGAREIALALVLASTTFPDRRVQIAIFGIGSIYASSSILLALGMRAIPKIRATRSRAPIGSRRALERERRATS